jgi:hypothetical protein
MSYISFMPRTLRLGAIFLASAALVFGVWLLIDRGAGQPHAGQTGGPDAAKPAGKLIVLVVFDQMRGDYLARWANQFSPGGFERIKKDGVWYSDVHLPYACSSTGPGHASIATGAPPSVHGIIENEWYERPSASHVYCVQPTRPFDLIPPPPKGTGSRGSEAGFSPERLLAETVGDRLQAASPKSRVVSLSIKDRTAVLLGGKKPAAAYCFDTRDGLFHTGAYYRDSVHPWVAEFNASGQANAWIGKEWARFRGDLDYEKLAGRDDAVGESYGIQDGAEFGQKRVFPHPYPSKDQFGKKAKTYYSCVEASPAGNGLLFELVKKAIAAEDLGNGDTPDLLCVSFSSNDLIGHLWGPDSHEMLDITLRSDQMMAEFLKFLDERFGDRYSVVITADHGVCPIPEQKRLDHAARKSLADLLPPLAAALDDTFGKHPAGPTNWFELDGRDAGNVWPWVYLNQTAIKARGLDPVAVADFAAQWIGNRPFMQTAFTRKQIESGTMPPVGTGREKEIKAILQQVKLSYRPDRCGDVIGIPQPGVLVTSYAEGTGHGSPHGYDTHVPVLAIGAGVPALGKRTEPKSSLIVAPTVAALLGIDPPATAKEKPAFEMK